MDHECSEECARDRRRAARMAQRLDACILGLRAAYPLYRRIHRAIGKTACPRSRADLREQLHVCACLVRTTSGG